MESKEALINNLVSEIFKSQDKISRINQKAIESSNLSENSKQYDSQTEEQNKIIIEKNEKIEKIKGRIVRR